MITYLQGKIIAIKEEDRYRLVDVLLSNGIGYQVITSKLTGYLIGSEVVFHTLLIVREDSNSLYGFRSAQEREIFEMLISVSGIGPKIAISVLSVFNYSELYDVILSEDISALGKVSGLGKKGAQKIVIDLKGKVEKLGLLVVNVRAGSKSNVLIDLESALKSLGFTGESLKQYLESAREITKETEYSLEELIKLVLKS